MTSMNRRHFIQAGATVAGGLMLGVSLPGLSSDKAGAVGMPEGPHLAFLVRAERSSPARRRLLHFHLLDVARQG